MRMIVAYLAACMVAATIIQFYIQYDIGTFLVRPPSMNLLVQWIVATLGLILCVAGVIGGILAIPWLSMYFVFGVNPTRRNCILFGAGCGLISILFFQTANTDRWPTQLNEIDLWRALGPTLLFTFAGIVAGLTYWIIVERNQT